MYRYTLALALIILQGCSYSDSEYFCESYHPIRFSKDITYSQQIIKLMPNEICANWRGDTPSCAKNGATTNDVWREDDSKESKSRDSFHAQFDRDLVTMFISKLVVPKDPSGITISKEGDGLLYAYRGVELSQLLPVKYDTEGNRKTWALYAITNVEYWNGKWFRDDNSFMVGGDTNKKTLTLTSRSLTDNFDSPHVFECQIWKKQRWWQF
jgi:hypothetical protein